jgi:hypothetical protein
MIKELPIQKTTDCPVWNCDGIEIYRKVDADRCMDYQKYRRCLAMAQEWRNYATLCDMQSHCHNHRGFGKTAEKYTWKEIHAWKCVHRYKELAEQFKEVYDG